VLQCARFDDSIGVNGWPIEEHAVGTVVFRWPHDPNGRGYNQLPYRMLLPQGVDNLLVAGRCASMTHLGQSAARVSGACFVMGQAAGTAARWRNRPECGCATWTSASCRRGWKRVGPGWGDELASGDHFKTNSCPWPFCDGIAVF
jgi:hypothetical protein